MNRRGMWECLGLSVNLHVTLVSVDPVEQCLWCHPLHRQTTLQQQNRFSARLYWPTAARPQVATARLKGLINMLYTRPLEPVSSHSHWWSFCSSLYCARLWPSQSLRSSSRCPLWPERSSLLGLCGYTEEHQDGTRQRQHKHTDTDVWL